MDDKLKLDLLRMATDLTVASIQADRKGVLRANESGIKALETVLAEWVGVVHGQFTKLGAE